MLKRAPYHTLVSSMLEYWRAALLLCGFGEDLCLCPSRCPLGVAFVENQFSLQGGRSRLRRTWRGYKQRSCSFILGGEPKADLEQAVKMIFLSWFGNPLGSFGTKPSFQQ